MNKFYWMVIGLLLGLVNLRAEIKLPALVSDNMVLQQATKVRLWGNATPNSSLKVRSSWDNTGIHGPSKRSRQMGNLGSDALGQFRKATVNIKEWTRQDCLA